MSAPGRFTTSHDFRSHDARRIGYAPDVSPRALLNVLRSTLRSTGYVMSLPFSQILHASESASSHSGIYASDDEDESSGSAQESARDDEAERELDLDRAARVIQEAAASEHSEAWEGAPPGY